METTVDELQKFKHLTGTISYDGDDWCIIITAGDIWVDSVPMTGKERDKICNIIRTPNLTTPITDFIAALKV